MRRPTEAQRTADQTADTKRQRHGADKTTGSVMIRTDPYYTCIVLYFPSLEDLRARRNFAQHVTSWLEVRSIRGAKGHRQDGRHHRQDGRNPREDSRPEKTADKTADTIRKKRGISRVHKWLPLKWTMSQSMVQWAVKLWPSCMKVWNSATLMMQPLELQ